MFQKLTICRLLIVWSLWASVSLIAGPRAIGQQADKTVMLVMAPAGPVLAEVNITVDGDPYQLWVTRFLAKTIDTNRDGELSLSELQLIPDRLVAQAQAGSPKRMMRQASQDKSATSVVADVFHAWFSRQLDRGFNVVAGAVQASEAVRLAAHIDANDDGRISEQEVRDAVYTMRFRDLDNDETFTASELMPFRDPRNQQAAVVPDAADLPFLQLTDNQTIQRGAEKICARYGDGASIPLESLRLPETATFDTSQDGRLQIAEIVALVSECPTHLTLNFQLSDRAGRSALTVDLPDTTDFCQFTGESRDRGRLIIDGMPIGLRAYGGGKGTRSIMVNFVLQYVSGYDSDKNGYLSEDEFPQMQQQLAQIQVNGSFQDVDMNNDEMVNREEIRNYIERDNIATQSRIDVSVKQDGKTLFKLLDVNSDRRLSRRELQTGFAALAEYDLSKDGQLTEEELGTAYALKISLGQNDAMRMSSMRNMNMQTGSTDAILPGLAGLEGPEWFRRMDRNQDRDVSQREFLGPRDVFTRLDQDKDGLLSAAEAATLDAEQR